MGTNSWLNLDRRLFLKRSILVCRDDAGEI